MTAHDFELDLTTHPDDGRVRFHLRNQDGQHLGAHQVRLADHGAALWGGLFDTRSHGRRYAGLTPADPAGEGGSIDRGEGTFPLQLRRQR